jgi:hypothetical protein
MYTQHNSGAFFFKLLFNDFENRKTWGKSAFGINCVNFVYNVFWKLSAPKNVSRVMFDIHAKDNTRMSLITVSDNVDGTR